MYTFRYDKPIKYTNFHVGDRVESRQGRKGTILFVKPQPNSDGILVEYDEPFPNGHDGNNIYGFGCGNRGRCWWHNLGDIELLKNEYEVDLL